MKRPLLALFLLPLVVFAQFQGPNNPSAATGVPNSSCLACPGGTWSSETNVFLADNNSAFVVAMSYPNCFQSNCYYSRYLYASGFGFTIPIASVITGIVAEVNRNPGNPNSIVDSTVRLYDGSNMVGVNKAGSTAWMNGFNYAAYGSMTDLWGASWLPVTVNSSGFGLYFKLYNSNPNVVATVSVDHIRLTVYYQTVSGIQSQTRYVGDSFSIGLENHEIFGSVVLNSDAKSALEICDLTGKVIRTYNLGTLKEGKQDYRLPVQELSSGIYFGRLIAGEQVVTRKFYCK